jgi:hypothetical protein
MSDEYGEQCAIFQWRDVMEFNYPELKLMFGTLNGVRLSIGAAVKAKAAGMTKGCPDIWLPFPRGDFHGLVIELKDGHGQLSPSQRWWLDSLCEIGYKATCCRGADDAIQTIMEYLGMRQ